MSINLTRAEAARNLTHVEAELRPLAYYILLLSRQGNIRQADKYLPRLNKLTQSSSLSDETYLLSQHALASAALARRDLDTAQQTWYNCLNHVKQKRLASHFFTVYQLWLGKCLYQRGMLTEAQQLLREALSDATQLGFQRILIALEMHLAMIALDQGDMENAIETLAASRSAAYQYQDRWSIAGNQRLYARLHILRGDLPAARAAFAEAIDLFERLGMRRELAEARAELAQLETRAVTTS